MTEREIFLEALEMATPEARAAYLQGACGRDITLRRKVDELLKEHFSNDSLLSGPALDGAARPGIAEFPVEQAPAQMIGRYKLLEKLGEGGFGEVWMAEQREPVKRRVALKIIKLGMDSRQIVARFEAERQALAMMDHPNIAKIFDAGTTGESNQKSVISDQRSERDPLTSDHSPLITGSGRPYFVMELVRGIKITEYCDQNQLPTVERLKLFILVCQAIQHAHQKGIIHRDIKPSNILVTLHDGVPVPKVIDFGIAKATQAELTDKTVFTQFQQFIGTPAYISPEQAEMSGLDVDTRADIYSLGVLLYELLVGQTPFDAKEMMQGGLDALRQIIREKEPLRPSTKLNTLQGEARTTAGKRRQTEVGKLVHQLQGDLDWIVMKCLEKDRTRRYETANGLAADLKRHLDNEPVLARPPSQIYRLQKMARRNKAATVGVASVALSLLLGLGLATAALVRERAARQRERTQSVRADTVTTFIDSLLSDQLPSLLRQGNVRGARELISKADALASSSLSNAPVAEFRLRENLYTALAYQLGDWPAALQQAERAERLLPRVPDAQLAIPLDQIRVGISVTRLWAAGDQIPAQEQALRELEGLYAEFMGRKPPARLLAADCKSMQAGWLSFAGKLDQAEAAIVEARELLLRAPAPASMRIEVPTLYVRLVGRPNPALAERVARESLGRLPGLDAGVRDNYWALVGELSNILCRQDRFTEATTMLEEQGRWLKTRGGSGTDQVRLDALRGAVLARSGNAREALPILEAVATNRLSSVTDWKLAVGVAARTGDHASFERLSRICWLRFGSTVEGDAALQAVIGLYLQPMDERTLAMARVLMDRADDGSIGSNLFRNPVNAVLAYREHRYPEALELVDRYLDTPNSRPGSQFVTDAAAQAFCLFLRALLGAELERTEEARRDFARARAQLKLALGERPGHDRGDSWFVADQAETIQREAETLFQAKGIPLPKPDAK